MPCAACTFKGYAGVAEWGSLQKYKSAPLVLLTPHYMSPCLVLAKKQIDWIEGYRTKNKKYIFPLRKAKRTCCCCSPEDNWKGNLNSGIVNWNPLSPTLNLSRADVRSGKKAWIRDQAKTSPVSFMCWFRKEKQSYKWSVCGLPDLQPCHQRATAR